MEGAGSLIVFALFIGIMYVMLIRPQQKRQKEHRELLASLQRGDDVITIGGMHGRIHRISDDYLDLEVTDDVVLRFQRQAIARKVTYSEPQETGRS